MSQSKCLSLVNSPSDGSSPNTEEKNIVVRNPKREREELTDSDYDDDSSDDEDVEWESIKTKQEENEPGFLLAQKKQWDKINQKLQVLKLLVPNCTEVSDTGIVIDRTIEYCKYQADNITIAMNRVLMMPYLYGFYSLEGMDLGMYPPGFMSHLPPFVGYPAPGPTESTVVRPAVVSESGDGEGEEAKK